jgi:alanine-glyoxylate transaminase / serine-glyoxylate transaminase / serine-pyruvate transaminase
MASERLLLGPGPSPVSPRVMRALGSPILSHLDPQLVSALDDVRERLARVFRADQGALTLAISGTGTSGMEAAVANITKPGTRALVVVTGYFGDRLAHVFERYGASVARVETEWGRACDPSAVERAIASHNAEIVAVVHGETSTGVVNPVEQVAAIARAHDAMVVVDAVTSFGATPMHAGAWGIDVCYSCSQKGLGAPSGLAPVTFSPRALQRRVPSRSFYLDLLLLEDYWVRRKYHHTLSSPLALAMREALVELEEETLETRWQRHQRVHESFVARLDSLGLSLLAPAGERLVNLNAVRVPDGVDEARVRRQLLDEFSIEIGAGLGPLAGRVWRVGLMGSGATMENVERFVGALERCLP